MKISLRWNLQVANHEITLQNQKLNFVRENGDFFLAICPENKRDKATLNKLILENVLPGDI